jgi:hypothetical protein
MAAYARKGRRARPDRPDGTCTLNQRRTDGPVFHPEYPVVTPGRLKVSAINPCCLGRGHCRQLCPNSFFVWCHAAQVCGATRVASPGSLTDRVHDWVLRSVERTVLFPSSFADARPSRPSAGFAEGQVRPGGSRYVL